MPTIDGVEISTKVSIRSVENGFTVECGYKTWVAATLKQALRLAGDAMLADKEEDN